MQLKLCLKDFLKEFLKNALDLHCFPNDPLLISEFMILLHSSLKPSLPFIVSFLEDVSSVLYEFTTLSIFWLKHWASGRTAKKHNFSGI